MDGEGGGGGGGEVRVCVCVGGGISVLPDTAIPDKSVATGTARPRVYKKILAQLS